MIDSARALSTSTTCPDRRDAPVGQRRQQNRHRHFAIEPGILRQIHLAHPTRAQSGADLVAPEFCARAQHPEGMRTPAHSIKGKTAATDTPTVFLLTTMG